jgi:hypothetical protein
MLNKVLLIGTVAGSPQPFYPAASGGARGAYTRFILVVDEPSSTGARRARQQFVITVARRSRPINAWTRYTRQQEARTVAEKKQAERRTAREQLNQAASQAKEQGTQVEREAIQGSTTRVQVQLDSYNNYYFLIGEAAIWYVEMQDVFATIWRLDYNAQLAEELQKLNSILA